MLLDLNNGMKIPQVALGTWKLTSRDQLFEVLDEALKQGINHIDTAEIYENEHIIGEWLGKQKREEILLHQNCGTLGTM